MGKAERIQIIFHGSERYRNQQFENKKFDDSFLWEIKKGKYVGKIINLCILFESPLCKRGILIINKCMKAANLIV